jgi:hypothetical protein
MCLLRGTNSVFISQKTTFFIVTAVKTSNLTVVTLLLARRVFHPDAGSDTFLQKVGSYKSHTVSPLRRRHSSFPVYLGRWEDQMHLNGTQSR